jgi:hypothetical protein
MSATHKEILFDAEYLTLTFDPVSQWLYCNWKGPQTTTRLREGFEKILLAIKDKACNKILNDHTLARGPWLEARDWLIDHWFPQASAAGLQYLAWVHGPDTFDQSRAKATLPRTEHFDGMTFVSVSQAVIWLRSWS